MSLGPGDSEPSQFRGDVVAGPAPLVPAGKTISIQDKSSQLKLSGVKSGHAHASPGTAGPMSGPQVTFDRAEAESPVRALWPQRSRPANGAIKPSFS